jgi:glycosyltransferase involved in cell wall biosynthesis
MRVLFYIGDKQWSATARLILTVARGLAARGHPVTLACCGESRLESEARAAQIDTVGINISGSAVGGAFDLRKVLAQKFIEVAIVTNERDHLIVSSAMRFAERGGVLRRVPAFEKLELQPGGKVALRLASTGIVVTTERELNDVKIPGLTIPATVAPIGVDITSLENVEPASRTELRTPSQGFIIACSYDPSGRYRLGTVFRTLALLAPRHVNIHVVLFGPGAADDELRMHASALGVSPVVSFLGEHDDHRRVMRAAHAGWVVAGADTAALSCLEFMALRVPVIAERSPLTQHYVADRITGLLLSSTDPSHTASTVAAFLTGEEKRLAMGNAGRVRVQRDYPESVMIDGFERAVNAAGDRTKWAAK